MVNVILKGVINITDNLNLVKDLIEQNDPGNLIINLDEDNKITGNNVLFGSILLPPPGAIMAELDGDIQAYDIVLSDYYGSSDVQMFITGIIFTLYMGRNIIIYSPDVFSQESISISKILDIFWNKFGIGIGIIGKSQCVYMPTFIPMWMNMMYDMSCIDARTFLIDYPEDASLQPVELDHLIADLQPIEQELKEKVKYIEEFRLKLKKKPDLKEVFYKVT